MPQNPEKIQDHVELFHQPEYKDLFARKREFEKGHSQEEIDRVAEPVFVHPMQDLLTMPHRIF